jgi:hypothetical protein
MLSWGILTLEWAIILFPIAAGSLNSNTKILDVIVLIIVASPMLGVILAAIEAIIQAIVVAILKKKQQA